MIVTENTLMGITFRKLILTTLCSFHYNLFRPICTHQIFTVSSFMRYIIVELQNSFYVKPLLKL